MKIVKNEDEKTKMYDREFVFDSIDDAKSAIAREEKRKKIWLYSIGTAAGLAFLVGLIIGIVFKDFESAPGFSLVAFLLFVAIAIVVSSGLSIFKWSWRAGRIVAHPFIFVSIKLFVGFIVAYLFFFISIIYSFIPWLMSRRQSKLIIKAAEEYISFHENFNTEEKQK